jgi:probable phosphoglycerate mutase
MGIIRTTMGLAPDGYTTDERIAEINLGLWDGLTDEEARALDPAKFDARLRDKWNVRVPGGENYDDVAKRAMRWLADLETNTFAVSHGAFTRILRGLFLGLDWKAMSDLDEPQGCVFRMRDGELTRLDLVR